MHRTVGQCWVSGVHFPGHIAPFGMVNHGDMGQHTDAIFAALHFVNYFKYTAEQDWLRNTSFPFLKQVADWWSCWLVKNSTGSSYRYNDAQDCTREGCLGDKANLNPLISIAFIRQLFKHLIDTSGITGAEPTTVSKWQDIIRHLAPLAVGTYHNQSVFLPQEQPYRFVPGKTHCSTRQS